jgi:TonB-linked SusC/RagA family outer membrane protein
MNIGYQKIKKVRFLRGIILKIFIFKLLLLININILAEDNKNIELHGAIIDNGTFLPVESVNVKLLNSKKGTVSNKQGRFTIQAPLYSTLQFSCLGYRTIEQVVESDTMYIYLNNENVMIEEVVVTSKNINDIDMRKIAGSIDVVSATELTDKPEMNLAMMLQGKVPGLVISETGELGSKPKIRIRGNSSFREGDMANEPLFVLDGMIISSESFYTINSEDFAEIKVLKDAAASALYGIKGANGVIEITSKRGYTGATRISYSGNMGITFRGERGVDMMDSEEKLELERLMQNVSLPGYRYSADYYNKYYKNAPNLNQLILEGQNVLDSLKRINTDWFKELIKMNTYKSHSLSIRGGNDNNQYYYSVNYSKQGGKIEGNDVTRLTGRMNLDYKVFKDFYVSVNSTVGFSETNTPNGPGTDPYSLIYTLNPYERKVEPNTGESPMLYSYPNRKYTDLINQYSSNSTSKRFEGSINANWDITKDLRLSAIIGADYLIKEAFSKTPPDAYSERNQKEEEKGSISKGKNTETNYSSNVRINYNKQIGKHDITLGANTDYYYAYCDDMGLKGYGIASKVNTAAGINQGIEGARKTTITSRKEKIAQMGIGFAMGYSYDATYDFYGSYKADASSILPSDKRWNTAWAIGGGWNMLNYDIFRNSKILTELRFKCSYGVTASLAGISPSSAVPTYKYSEEVYAGARLFELQEFYNSDLKPEQTKSSNIGFGFRLFNRFGVDVDFYKRRTEEALLAVPIPSSNGYTTMSRNVGVLGNNGVEFKIDGDVIDRDFFRWNSFFSISWNENKVIDLYDGDKLYTGDQLVPDMEVGKPLGVIYGLESLGIHSIDGMPRYLSATGEELTYQSDLTREDFINLGYSTPPYNGSFNNSFTYQDFSLTFDIYFTLGGIQQASRSYVRDVDNVQYNAVKGQTQDMWFKIGDENKIYHKPNLPGSAYDILRFPTTRTVYKTDFIRLNNIKFTYNVSKHTLQSLGGFLRYAKFNVQAQNLYTYKFETDKGSLNNELQPVLTFGVSLTF